MTVDILYLNERKLISCALITAVALEALKINISVQWTVDKVVGENVKRNENLS